MLFLVQALVEVKRYMTNCSISQPDIRLVEADDYKGAEYKYFRYWERQDDPYSNTYSVSDIKISEVLT